jgi:CRISPR-associated protein Csd2
MTWEQYIPADIVELYKVHDFKHAAAIIAKEFPAEFAELCQALRKFRFNLDDIKIGCGSESHIPKIFSDILRPIGWSDKNLEAELNVY